MLEAEPTTNVWNQPRRLQFRPSQLPCTRLPIDTAIVSLFHPAVTSRCPMNHPSLPFRRDISFRMRRTSGMVTTSVWTTFGTRMASGRCLLCTILRSISFFAPIRHRWQRHFGQFCCRRSQVVFYCYT